MLYTFEPKKSYDCLFNVKPKHLVLLKTYKNEFEKVNITFTDQNGRLLEGKVTLTVLINK